VTRTYQKESKALQIKQTQIYHISSEINVCVTCTSLLSTTRPLSR